MKAKKMKIISKITNEITSFYLEKGAEKIEIDIAINDAKNGYDIYTYGTVELSAAEVKEMKKSMEVHQDILGREKLLMNLLLSLKYVIPYILIMKKVF